MTESRTSATSPDDLDDVVDLDAIAATSQKRLDEARALLAHIQKSRGEQPERLAKAREDAEQARTWAEIEEPLREWVTAVRGVEDDSATLALPTLIAKELFGARMAFDFLDCGDDFDRIDEVQNRYFAMCSGDTGLLFLLAFSALSTITSVVVPQLLDVAEQRASDWDIRAMLAEARAKSWNGRVADITEEPAEDDQ